MAAVPHTSHACHDLAPIRRSINKKNENDHNAACSLSESESTEIYISLNKLTPKDGGTANGFKMRVHRRLDGQHGAVNIIRRLPARKLQWAINCLVLFTCFASFVHLDRIVDSPSTIFHGVDDASSAAFPSLNSDRSSGVPLLWGGSRNNTSATSRTSVIMTGEGTNKHVQPQKSYASPSHRTVSRKWAYAFLLGGCDPEVPEYRGFLYNILMVTRRLRRLGSQADMVLLVQLSITTKDLTLPAQEEQMLKDLNIKVRYLPTIESSVGESFYSLMMEKFRILEFAGEYSRVLFLDSDQWPLCGLDFLFELSDPPPGVTPKLKENMLLAWKVEPCNGGFFMFAPKHGDFEQISSIIRRREEEALQMSFPHWNQTIGWGHIFDKNDLWKPVSSSVSEERKRLWGWHGAYTDQGLIYYWAKYVKQSVSIIINDFVEHWGSCDGQACLESNVPSEFGSYKCAGGSRQPGTPSVPPYSSIFHMSGAKKPWCRYERNTSITDDWFKELSEMEKELFGNDSLSKEIQKVRERKRNPPVGAFPHETQMYQHIKRKAHRNWNPYETAEERMDKF